MSPIVLMDKIGLQFTHSGTIRDQEYRQPDDSVSFWTGKYPTAGKVRAFHCGNCGRIALYGAASDP
jgi:hypothetical protein